MKRFLLLAILAITMTSCATIISGTNKRVTFDGEVSKPATMIVDGRQYKNVTLPYKVNVKRGFKDSEVRIAVEGYEPVTIWIDKNFNPWAILNLTDLFGWAIDIATGAVTQPAMDHYWIDFIPKAE